MESEGTVGHIKYKIYDGNHMVEMWDLDNPNVDADNAPFARQDIDPRDGQPWTSREDAESWLQAELDAFNR